MKSEKYNREIVNDIKLIFRWQKYILKDMNKRKLIMQILILLLHQIH